MSARGWLTVMTGIAVSAGLGACGGDGGRVEPVVLPAGTTMTVSMDQPLTTRVNRAGDGFEATLTQPVTREGRILLPAGTNLRGEVREARSAAEPGGPVLALAITRAIPAPSPSFSIETAPVSIERAAPTGGPVEASAGSVAGAGGMPHGEAAAGGSDAARSNAATREIEISAGRTFEVSVLRAVEIGGLAGQ